MFGRKIFGRKSDGGDNQGLALQRNAYNETLAYFSEFDERVTGLDGLAQAFPDVWHEPAEVTQLKKDCASIREGLRIMGERLAIATAPLPNFTEWLPKILDRVESGEVILQNLVVDLTTRQALANANKQSEA